MAVGLVGLSLKSRNVGRAGAIIRLICVEARARDLVTKGLAPTRHGKSLVLAVTNTITQRTKSLNLVYHIGISRSLIRTVGKDRSKKCITDARYM